MLKTVKNKMLSYYMSLPYKLKIVKDTDEGGFVSYYPDLPGCISSGESEQEAAANAQDAKRAWLEAALESKINIKEPSYHELNDYSVRSQAKVNIDKYRVYACLTSLNNA